MKIRIKNITKLILPLLLACFLNMSYGQDYGIKVIPLDFVSNPKNLWERNDKIYMSSINYIGSTPGTSIVEMNGNLDILETYFHPNFIIGRNSPQISDNEMYAYGKYHLIDDRSILVKFDENFNIARRDTYQTESINFDINSMNQLNGEIIGVGIDENLDCELLSCYEMNIRTIDTEGSQLSSFNLDKDELYFFSSKNSVTKDNNILIGGIIYAPSATASIYKVSTDGSVAWNYKSSAKSSRGNIPISTLELPNGNIVYTDKINKSDDDEYIEQGYTSRPNQLVWLSSEGEPLKSYLDTVSWKSGTEYNGITAGKGDYFFVHGDYSRVSQPIDDQDGEYGLIMKMSNEGDIIWRKSFQIGDNLEYPNNISHLIEMDNGDIITVGTAVAFPSLKTWMMRLDENGCFGADNCDEFNIATSTVDLPALSKEKEDLLYPIPTADKLYLQKEQVGLYSTYTIIDMYGHSVRAEQELDHNSIPTHDLHNGVYFIYLSDGEDHHAWQNVVVQR